MKRKKGLFVTLLTILLLLVVSHQAVLAAESVVRLTVPSCS